MLYANGDEFEGDFLENKKHGFGKYIYADKTYYEGHYKEDI